MSSVMHTTQSYRRVSYGRVAFILGNVAIWAALVFAGIALL